MPRCRKSTHPRRREIAQDLLQWSDGERSQENSVFDLFNNDTCQRTQSAFATLEVQVLTASPANAPHSATIPERAGWRKAQ
jgi:hypothetical protein